jgi:hypothetical protein
VPHGPSGECYSSMSDVNNDIIRCSHLIVRNDLADCRTMRKIRSMRPGLRYRAACRRLKSICKMRVWGDNRRRAWLILRSMRSLSVGVYCTE